MNPQREEIDLYDLTQKCDITYVTEVSDKLVACVASYCNKRNSFPKSFTRRVFWVFKSQVLLGVDLVVI